MLASHLDRARRRSAVANCLDESARFHLAESPAVVDIYLRKHQRQSCESVDDVVPDGLADLVFGARVVEDVVRDLKRQAELSAVRAQSAPLIEVQPTEQRADVAARGQ